MGSCDREGKEANKGPVHEQVTAVVSCGPT